MALEKIRQKSWNYTLYKSDNGALILSVVCGGSAMYELNIPVDNADHSLDLSDEKLEKFAQNIRDKSFEFSKHSIQLKEFDAANAMHIKHVAAGARCPRAGWWFTPAKANSRHHFKQGDVFPIIEGSAYGDTYWQWSTDQSDPTL